ncbi:glycosyltransferase family 4 protein [Blautia wexlerae]|uniref:glycosyltransferase family 4 protein n=1 Tax=Blautia wexlerae TaxID=418240 RepID=UPI00156F8EBD|nr:glycosyltransferase family 4 protein [Blautia wexlerae]NSF39976.1 glycosyltransferase family 4 protein [Blautia wexlerae]
MKRALIVAATGGFLNGFLIPDMKLLQEMGYEVHCAANGNSVSTFVPEEQFASIGVTFHQIDFSSTSPISKESLTAYKQYKELLNKYQFDFVHVHTPIPGAIVRMATRRKRKRGCVVAYTTHGLTFPKGSSLKTKIVYGGVEWLCSWMTDGIITINREDYAQMKKMGCKNVYHINGVGVDTSRYHECQIDREIYRKSLGLSENDIAILEVGELSTRKNHKVIIDALEKLADQRYVFLICGKAMSNLGTYDFLKKYAEEKKVRVIFLGFRKDIPEINRCADIAVLPSLREGLGLAGIEALASGVPVVGSDVQGIKDYVVDGETGYLCAPNDADAFAEKIKLLSDREVRFSMQKACVKKAEEFRLEISHQQMTDIYKNLLSGQEKSK